MQQQHSISSIAPEHGVRNGALIYNFIILRLWHLVSIKQWKTPTKSFQFGRNEWHHSIFSLFHYFLFLSTVLRASCTRKQSLTIFHLSPSAVIMNVCWNCFGGLFCRRIMPDTMTKSVFWFPVTSSLTGWASNVAIECSVVGSSRKNFCMLSLLVVPFPFHEAVALSKYSRDISCMKKITNWIVESSSPCHEWMC